MAACHNDGEELLSRIGGHPDDIIRQRSYRKHLSKHGPGRDSFGNPLALTLPTEGSNARQTVMSLFDRPPVQRARNRIYLHFIDALLRTALFAFDGMTDENGPLQPANMIKALFQQLSRTLSRSRITKILLLTHYMFLPRGLNERFHEFKCKVPIYVEAR